MKEKQELCDEKAEEEVGELSKLLQKHPNRRSRRAYINWSLKQYETQLVNKLPNEFKKSLDGYNPRNSSDFLIDENQYGYF